MVDKTEIEELQKLLGPSDWHLGWEARQKELQRVSDGIRIAYAQLNSANQLLAGLEIDADDKLILKALLGGLAEPLKELTQKVTRR